MTILRSWSTSTTNRSSPCLCLIGRSPARTSTTPPRLRRLLSDLAALRRGQLLGAGKTALLAAEFAERDSGGVLADFHASGRERGFGRGRFGCGRKRLARFAR